MEARETLMALVEKYQGNWQKIFDAVQDKEDVNDATGEKLRDDLWNKCKAAGIEIVTLVDPDYPQAFKSAAEPPFVVFYKGNLGLINKGDEHRVYVTGCGQTISDFGKRAAVKVALDLAGDDEHILVTSDMSAAEVVTQKAARAVTSEHITVMKTAMIASTALDNTGANRVLMDNIVLSGGVVLSTIPAGSAEIDATGNKLAAVLSAGNIIVVELGAKPAKDFIAEVGLGSITRCGYAVIHDVTAAQVDCCHELVTNYGYKPYIGNIHLY